MVRFDRKPRHGMQRMRIVAISRNSAGGNCKSSLNERCSYMYRVSGKGDQWVDDHGFRPKQEKNTIKSCYIIN